MTGEPPVQKQYFIKTDATFQQIYAWMRAEQRRGLEVTEYCEIRRPFINGNAEPHNPANPRPREWSRMYDFSRTAHAILRLMMLKVTELIQLHNPEIAQAVRRRNEANFDVPAPVPRYNRPINHGNHLAGDEYEAQWITAHFDMLFPHFYIENRLNGIQINEVRALRNNQLVIVDTRYHVVWEMIVSLDITRLEDPDPRLGVPVLWRFNAIPNVAVIRMEYKYPPGHRPAPEYPFRVAGQPQQPADDEIDQLRQQLAAGLQV